jgi:hypothetical protein
VSVARWKAEGPIRSVGRAMKAWVYRVLDQLLPAKWSTDYATDGNLLFIRRVRHSRYAEDRAVEYVSTSGILWHDPVTGERLGRSVERALENEWRARNMRHLVARRNVFWRGKK